MSKGNRVRLACDLPDSDLALALSTAERPDLLRSLVETSRDAFGFFPNHYPDTISYPWLTERLESLPPAARVLDIGAGISPMAVWLAKRGCFVETVDSHQMVRTLPATDDWTGWGYLNYQQLHQNITSHHCEIEKFAPARKFDAIYSACVLMLLTRKALETALRNCREWLPSGGILLFTIDLVPFSDFLWNRAEGREVEPLLRHGAIFDLVQQLNTLDIRIDQLEVVRAIKNSRTDLLLVSGTAV
jgi:SAM-dependent methyltransferase